MAVSLIYLTDFLEKLPQLKIKLQKMKSITNDLRVYASQLSDGKVRFYFIFSFSFCNENFGVFLLGLRGVKRELLVMLTKCNNKACQDVLNKYEIGKLDANGIHYDQVSEKCLLTKKICLLRLYILVKYKLFSNFSNP